jgi:uncharacterized protein YegL
MKRKSHKIQWKLLAGLLVLVAAIIISLSSISAVPYLEGNKSVSPNILYVGDNATITLTVNGAGNMNNVRVPMDIILVIDNSCSMCGNKISQAKLAGKAIVNILDSLYDRVGLVYFNTNPFVKNNLTKDYVSVKNNIDTISASGNTNIGEAIKKASEQFNNTMNSKVIVLISDGKANLPADAKAYALQQANLAAAKNISIYTIGIGEEFNTPGFNLLKNISNISNGIYWHYPTDSDPHTMNDIAHWIVDDVRSKEITVIAGENIIITDFLALGVVPISLPFGCNYTLNTRKMTCNAGLLKINESKSFSFNVIVYNSSLAHLNEIAYVNYTTYLGNNASFILNNPNVTVLTNSTICTNCNNTNTTNNSCIGNTAPVLTIVSPVSRIYNNTLVTVSISALDSNLSHVWYTLNGVNFSYSGSTIANLSNGNYTLVAYANDSCGSLSSVHTHFIINTSSNGTNNTSDNLGPNVTIISPVNQIYTSNLVRLTILAVDDVVVDDVWYSLNGVRYNYNYSYLMNLSNGNYTLIAYANDSSSNIGVDSVSFIVNVSQGVDCDKDPDCDACRSHTRAPVNDFDYNETADSVSMDDDFVIALNYQNGSVNEGFNMDSYISGKTNQLIFNMILLIAIIVLLLLIVLIIRRTN